MIASWLLMSLTIQSKVCSQIKWRSRGFTLIELIVATAMLVIFTAMAMPLARVTIKREKEHELRHDLWVMRDAIDRYKDTADKGGFQTKVDTRAIRPIWIR